MGESSEPELATRDLDVRVDGVTLRVRTLRQAVAPPDSRPPLVFLHDSLGCIGAWRDFPARLAAATGCDALVFDRRGYGESDPFAPAPRTTRYLEEESDVLPAVLDACGVQQAILFGHSDGGSIALLAAARHPSRVRALVTEGAHVFVEEVTLTGIRNALGALESSALRERLVVYHGDKADRVTSAWIDTWLRPDFRDWNIEDALPRVAVPTLVVQGEHDEFGSEAQVESIVRGVAGPAEALLVPGVGHTPHRDDPAAVIDATVAFLRRHGIVAA